MWKTLTYNSWRSMKARAHTGSSHKAPAYKGRGIRVCDRWLVFAHFVADMGERPHGTTLDRIDNEGHYEPGNCRWATHAEQQANRRDTRRITAFSRTQTLTQWANEIGISRQVLWARLRKHPPERALSPLKWAVGRPRIGASNG